MIRVWPRRPPKPLGGCLDVAKCLRCGATEAHNADGLTFRNPTPLECKRCPGEPDMQVGRYYSTITTPSAPTSEGTEQ